MVKASYIYNETLDPRGRFIRSEEFRKIVAQFKDRYDPKRLCLKIMYESGLRGHRAVDLRVSDFSKDFTSIKTSRCKARRTHSDGIVRFISKPNYSLLSDSLAQDLRYFIRYRTMVAQYVGEGLEDFQLFPRLTVDSLKMWMARLRHNKRGQKEWEFLFDPWKRITRYDKEMRLIDRTIWYRIAIHGLKSYSITAAYQVTDKDLVATKMHSGHSKTKTVETYVKVIDFDEQKKEIKERYMDTISSTQRTPLLVGQKKLVEF